MEGENSAYLRLLGDLGDADDTFDSEIQKMRRNIREENKLKEGNHLWDTRVHNYRASGSPEILRELRTPELDAILDDLSSPLPPESLRDLVGKIISIQKDGRARLERVTKIISKLGIFHMYSTPIGGGRGRGTSIHIPVMSKIIQEKDTLSVYYPFSTTIPIFLIKNLDPEETRISIPERQLSLNVTSLEQKFQKPAEARSGNDTDLALLITKAQNRVRFTSRLYETRIMVNAGSGKEQLSPELEAMAAPHVPESLQGLSGEMITILLQGEALHGEILEVKSRLGTFDLLFQSHEGVGGAKTIRIPVVSKIVDNERRIQIFYPFSEKDPALQIIIIEKGKVLRPVKHSIPSGKTLAPGKTKIPSKKAVSRRGASLPELPDIPVEAEEKRYQALFSYFVVGQNYQFTNHQSSKLFRGRFQKVIRDENKIVLVFEDLEGAEEEIFLELPKTFMSQKKSTSILLFERSHDPIPAFTVITVSMSERAMGDSKPAKDLKKTFSEDDTRGSFHKSVERTLKLRGRKHRGKKK